MPAMNEAFIPEMFERVRKYRELTGAGAEGATAVVSGL